MKNLVAIYSKFRHLKKHSTNILRFSSICMKDVLQWNSMPTNSGLLLEQYILANSFDIYWRKAKSVWSWKKRGKFLKKKETTGVLMTRHGTGQLKKTADDRNIGYMNAQEEEVSWLGFAWLLHFPLYWCCSSWLAAERIQKSTETICLSLHGQIHPIYLRGTSSWSKTLTKNTVQHNKGPTKSPFEYEFLLCRGGWTEKLAKTKNWKKPCYLLFNLI